MLYWRRQCGQDPITDAYPIIGGVANMQTHSSVHVYLIISYNGTLLPQAIVGRDWWGLNGHSAR